MDGLHGRSGRVGKKKKSPAPKELESRTVRYVASRYTDCAIPSPKNVLLYSIIYGRLFTIVSHIPPLDDSMILLESSTGGIAVLSDTRTS
jgi:hypothetical protein